MIVGVLAGLVYFGMVALTTYVVPQPHQIIEPVTIMRLNK
jgi:putative flippase GtrA